MSSWAETVLNGAINAETIRMPYVASTRANYPVPTGGLSILPTSDGSMSWLNGAGYQMKLVTTVAADSTFTMPPASTATLVDTTSIQTLSNKTFLTPVQINNSITAQDLLLASGYEKWEDLNMLGVAKGTGAAQPTYSVFMTNFMAWSFINGADKELYFENQFPHRRKYSSDIRFHVHWCPSTAAAGNVTWRLSYTICEIGSTWTSGSVLSDITVPAPGVAYQHTMSNFATIALASTGPSANFYCRLQRVGSTDTYAAPVFLTGFDVHYLIDKPAGDSYT